MAGNNRDFGSLEFRRLLKRFILSGGHKIPLLPGSPIKLADQSVADASIPSVPSIPSKPQEKVFDEPLLSQEVTDELWNEDTEAPLHKFNIDEIDTSKPVPVDNPEDFLFDLDEIEQDVQMHLVGERAPIVDPDDCIYDEIAPEMQMHIIGEEGFNYYAG